MVSGGSGAEATAPRRGAAGASRGGPGEKPRAARQRGTDAAVRQSARAVPGRIPGPPRRQDPALDRPGRPPAPRPRSPRSDPPATRSSAGLWTTCGSTPPRSPAGIPSRGRIWKTSGRGGLQGPLLHKFSIACRSITMRTGSWGHRPESAGARPRRPPLVRPAGGLLPLVGRPAEPPGPVRISMSRRPAPYG